MNDMLPYVMAVVRAALRKVKGFDQLRNKNRKYIAVIAEDRKRVFAYQYSDELIPDTLRRNVV